MDQHIAMYILEYLDMDCVYYDKEGCQEHFIYIEAIRQETQQTTENFSSNQRRGDEDLYSVEEARHVTV